MNISFHVPKRINRKIHCDRIHTNPTKQSICSVPQGQRNVKNRRKLQQFSLKIAKNVYKLQNFAKFPSKIAKKSQIFRQILLKMIKFRIFEKIAKKCSFQLGKKPSFENRFGKKFGKTPVLKNDKKTLSNSSRVVALSYLALIKKILRMKKSRFKNFPC